MDDDLIPDGAFLDDAFVRFTPRDREMLLGGLTVEEVLQMGYGDQKSAYGRERPDVHPLSDPDAIVRFLNQERWWVPANQEPIRIKDMDIQHLHNALAYMVEGNHAEQFMILYIAAEPNREAPADRLATSYTGIGYAKEFIADLPLFRAMVQALHKAIHDKKSPWDFPAEEDEE